MPKSRSKPVSKRRRTPNREYRIFAEGPGFILEIRDLDLSRVIKKLVGEMVGGGLGGGLGDHYETLGVKPGATPPEIDEAYIHKIVKAMPSDALERAIQVAVAERDWRAQASS